MSAGYRLVSYVGAQNQPQAGILVGDRVIASSDILGPKFNSVIDILRAWGPARAEWQAAMEALLLVAELDGPPMFAHIGIMRAISRHVGRVKHWVKGKLARGSSDGHA